MKVFDCFLFFGEFEALNIRFHELQDVVDYHVIVEGRMTFSGQPRAAVFDATDPRWAPFIEKVIHVVVDDTPELASDWDRESFQRNAILRGLDMVQLDRSAPVCDAQDLVLICDADEIPSAQAVRWVADRLARGVATFELSFYYYHLNQSVCQPSSGDAKDSYQPISWWLAKAARRAEIRWPQELRDHALHDSAYVAPRGGWHFSYLGGVQRIQTKIAAFSHQEYNQPQYTAEANIADAINSGRDLFGRDSLYHFRTVPIDDSFPRFVVENQESLAGAIKAIDKPTSGAQLEAIVQAPHHSPDHQAITRIVEATYGSGADVADVTERLKQRLRNGHLSLTVSNALFGDPAPNKRKTLRFTYEVFGDVQQYRHEAEEHEIVSLGALATHQASSHPARSLVRELFSTESNYNQFPRHEFSSGFSAAWSMGPLFDRLIESQRPHRIIEVGSWEGASAIHMARCCVEQGVACEEILCVDTWLGSAELLLAAVNGETITRSPYFGALRYRWGYPQLYYTFLGNVLDAGLQDTITPVPLTSDVAYQIFKDLAVTADLIYIDGAHDFTSVLRDLRMYWEILEPGGTLFGDDYSNSENVRDAVELFTAETNLTYTVEDGKYILRKTGEA